MKRALIIAACALLLAAPTTYAGRENKWSENKNDNSSDSRIAASSGGLKAMGTISAKDCTIRQSQNVDGCTKDFNGGYTITFKTSMASDTYVVVGTYTFAEGGGTVVNVSNRERG